MKIIRMQHVGLVLMPLILAISISAARCAAGDLNFDKEVAQAQAWLDGVKAEGPDRIVAQTPPPYPAQVLLGRRPISWPAGEKQFTMPEDSKSEHALAAIDGRKELMLRVRIQANEQTLSRAIELPPDYPMTMPDPRLPLKEHRQKHLDKLVAQRACTLTAYYDAYFVEGMVRRIRCEAPVHNKERLDTAMGRIDHRIDCADFDMAFALRFYRLGAGTKKDRDRIRQAALKFRYWDDEPGEDGMVFRTENHALLFYSDRLIAGNLWPDEVFTNSGRKGRDQAALGKQQCLAWLDRVEARGYEEFLSTTYAPITIGALLNLVDFSDDADISRRASHQVDRIFRMMAEHSFDGVMMGPQGRTSRRMLYPQMLTTQALMAYATPQAIEAFDPWTAFVASSSYRLPYGLDSLMSSPVKKQYREGAFLVNLNKTTDYMLGSIEIPASASDGSLRGGPKPGQRGHQQHIWHATLARDCHVFTTYPGRIDDIGDGKPGFWTGNERFPRQTQNGNTLMQIFSIPKEHPTQFTHAYWPKSAFDAEEMRGNWAFGRKNKSYVALWCSTKPVLRSEVLIDRELRASGSRMAWVCVCSSESESGDFQAFIRSCEKLMPEFDEEALTLRVDGQPPMKWDD